MVEVIKINTKSYPVKFGFNALRHFTDLTGMTLNEISNIANDLNLSHAIILIYVGLKDGARVTQEKFELSIDDIGDMLDDDNTIIEKMMSIFSKQMSGKSKKKVTNKKALKRS
jgi:hypothetical protein